MKQKGRAATERLALSVAEAADLIGIGGTKMRELIAAGQVKSFRVGARVLIPKDEVDAWIARQLTAATVPR